MRTESNRPVIEPKALPTVDGDWEKKVPYTFGPLTLVIEFLAGDTRSKTAGGGVVIKNEFPVAYGRIQGTTDSHGEEVDFSLAAMPTLDGKVWVIDQITPATGQFDEHKVMLGFSALHEVIHNYTSVFGDNSGRSRIGAVTTFPDVASFNKWLTSDTNVLRPSSAYTAPGVTSEKGAGIQPFYSPGMGQPAQRDEVGGVIVNLPDLSKGPKIETKIDEQGAYHYHLYFFSGLSHDVWSNPIDVFCRALEMAKAGDVAHIHIASPGGSVILMGRVISAINRTKAKVITYAEGCVASAATAIWTAGHERHISPGAYFMQHMSSQLLGGKTTDIHAKAQFCIEYITSRLDKLVATGLFTQEEMDDMVEKSSDVYISGRTAIERVGAVSSGTKASKTTDKPAAKAA